MHEVNDLYPSSPLQKEDLPLQKTSHTSTSNPRLTVGVELEMSLATLPLSKADPTPSDPRKVHDLIPEDPDWIHPTQPKIFYTLDVVTRKLTEAGIASVPEGEEKLLKGGEWIVASDGTIENPGLVDIALIDLKEEGNGYDYHGIELISPPLFYSTAALEYIRCTCIALPSLFRLHLNLSTGLHIHVGNRKSGFSFATLRNLFSTIWTFEPQIDQIYGPHRLKSYQIPRLRSHSSLGHKAKASKDSAGTGLQLFRDCKTMEDLAEATKYHGNDGYGKRMGYSMTNIIILGDSKITFEFRQHISSLDPEVVETWTRFCVGLVEFADSIDNTVLEKILDQRIRETPESFGIGKLCASLGMPDLAAYYENRVKEQRVLDEERGEEENLQQLELIRRNALRREERKEVGNKRADPTGGMTKKPHVKAATALFPADTQHD
jgi:hypothetical protein